MKAIIIDEKRLDEKRDALLNKLEVNASKRTSDVGHNDKLIEYRTIHYYIHEFVDAIKEDK